MVAFVFLSLIPSSWCLFSGSSLAVRLSSFYLLLTFCSLISETVAVVAEVSDGGNCTQRCLGAHLSVSQLRTVAVIMISKLFAEAVSKQKESETLNVKDCLLAASCLADLNDFFPHSFTVFLIQSVGLRVNRNTNVDEKSNTKELITVTVSCFDYRATHTHTCEQSI